MSDDDDDDEIHRILVRIAVIGLGALAVIYLAAGGSVMQ